MIFQKGANVSSLAGVCFWKMPLWMILNVCSEQEAALLSSLRHLLSVIDLLCFLLQLSFHHSRWLSPPVRTQDWTGNQLKTVEFRIFLWQISALCSVWWLVAPEVSAASPPHPHQHSQNAPGAIFEKTSCSKRVAGSWRGCHRGERALRGVRVHRGSSAAIQTPMSLHYSFCALFIWYNHIII